MVKKKWECVGISTFYIKIYEIRMNGGDEVSKSPKRMRNNYSLAKQGNVEAITELCKHYENKITQISDYLVSLYKSAGVELDKDDLMQDGYVGILTCLQKEPVDKIAARMYWHIFNEITNNINDRYLSCFISLQQLETVFFNATHSETNLQQFIEVISSTRIYQLGLKLPTKEYYVEDIEEQLDINRYLQSREYNLTPKEAKVLYLYYYKHESLIKISERLQVTSERIRQIKKKAEAKLAHKPVEESSQLWTENPINGFSISHWEDFRMSEETHKDHIFELCSRDNKHNKLAPIESKDINCLNTLSSNNQDSVNQNELLNDSRKELQMETTQYSKEEIQDLLKRLYTSLPYEDFMMILSLIPTELR